MLRLESELRRLLVPSDPNDGRNVIMEIRGAEGGEEANLFARDLFDMYSQLRRATEAGRFGCCRNPPRITVDSTRSSSSSRVETPGNA